MKKNITVSGANGTFYGEVEIVFNAERREKLVHNRSTHDEEGVGYYIHQIKGEAHGKTLPISETEQEEEVPALADQMEKQVADLLKLKAEQVKKPSPNTILKERGYK